MILLNVKEQIQAGLSNILPTYYELLCKKATKPCITYIESGNVETLKGDTLEYSIPYFTIKIWGNGNDIKTVSEKALLVDEFMKSIGFKRNGGNELLMDTQICKILNYQCLGQEGTDAWY